MKSYWYIHMKNGRHISFNKKCHYIDSKDGVMYFMTNHIERKLIAAIPIENILWIESFDEE